MEKEFRFTKEHTKIAKGVALLLMLFDHLYWFNSYDYTTFIDLNRINNIPWLIGSIGNICVSMFLFLSGYGMFFCQKDKQYSIKDAIKRIYNIWIRYAIITSLIVVLDLMMDKIELDVKTIVLNFFALDYTYNKYAWFVITYIVIVLVFPLINKIFNRTDIITEIVLVVGIKILITVINSFLQKNFAVGEITYKVLIEPFMFLPVFLIGYICAEYGIFEKILKLIQNKLTKNFKIVLVLILVGTFAFMLLFEATIFDNITAPILCFAIPYTLLNSKIAEGLKWLGKMSTNMWLIHYPITITWLNELVYAPKYWLWILIWLIVLMIPFCYFIDWACKKIKF